MAQGNSSGKSSRARGARKAPPPRFQLSPAQQEQIVAGVLIVIAILTALGAFNLSSGNLLDGWTRVLSMLFGWGRFLAPFFFAGFGLWLLLDSLDMRPDIGWERPLALILAFFCVATFLQIVAVNFMALSKTSFQAAQIGLGGGLMGHLLYDVLVGGLGLAGALLVLLVVFAIALILFFNLSLPQLFQTLGNGWRQVMALFERGANVKITRNGKARVPTEMVTAPPQKSNDNRRESAEPLPRLPSDFGADEILDVEPPARSAVSAHIIGGGALPPLAHREWRLPRVADILEESVEQDASPQEIRERVKKIEETLAHFGVPAKVIEVNQGPTITQFGVEPG
ncbi:MAG: hypothetical protein DCC52_06245, partial [Chloroflexi bacterium]